MALNKKTTCSSCWTPKPSSPGISEFDKYYVNYEVKQVVKKVGEGEEDYILEDKIVTHTDSIQGVIDSHADEVGVYKLIERVMRTGDTSLLDSAHVHVTDSILDVTGAPQTLADGLHAADAQKAAYEALPDQLKKGRTLEQFLNTITQEEYNLFIQSLMPKEKEAKE